MSITQQHFREILDELEISHTFHKDTGIIEFIMSQTKPFAGNFKFLFIVSEECSTIQARGLLGNLDLDNTNDFNAAYRFCNQWHNDTLMPKVIVNDEEKYLFCEWTWDTDYEISDDQLKGLILAKFIKITMDCINKAVAEGLYPMVPKTQE